MKTTRKSKKMMNNRGFTIWELLAVIAIIMTLLLIVGFNYKEWMDKYNAESQIRMMHADLLQARVRAMERNRQHFIVMTAGPTSNYQIYEDTNESGGNAPDAGDTTLFPTPKLLRYPSTSAVTIIIDPRGIISTSTSSLVNSLSVSFNTASGTPEYDCFQLFATRINIGKMNGGNCVPR